MFYKFHLTDFKLPLQVKYESIVKEKQEGLHNIYKQLNLAGAHFILADRFNCEKPKTCNSKKTNKNMHWLTLEQ